MNECTGGAASNTHGRTATSSGTYYNTTLAAYHSDPSLFDAVACRLHGLLYGRYPRVTGSLQPPACLPIFMFLNSKRAQAICLHLNNVPDSLLASHIRIPLLTQMPFSFTALLCYSPQPPSIIHPFQLICFRVTIVCFIWSQGNETQCVLPVTYLICANITAFMHTDQDVSNQITGVHPRKSTGTSHMKDEGI